MHLDDDILTFGRAMRERHGRRLHKVSVDAAFTCPNRDGTRGRGGCTFCNNNSFSPAQRKLPVREQIALGRAAIRHARPEDGFLAYFQSYTNTYDSVCRLEALYREALAADGVVGLSVGTRPDCVPEPVLDLLAQLRDEGRDHGREVWLELGLQSAFDDTLARINRGHSFAEYEDAVRRARRRGLQVCTHLIAGLPGETPARWHASLARVLALGTDGLKIHPLHVVRHTRLALDWVNGDYQPIARDEYVEAVARMVLACPPDLVFHRLTGTARPPLLLAPAWCAEKWPVLNAIGSRVRALRADTGVAA